MKVYVSTAPLSDKVKRLLDDPEATRELLQGLAQGEQEFEVRLDDQKLKFRPARERHADEPTETSEPS